MIDARLTTSTYTHYEDPLSNYDPPQYRNALERLLAETPVSEVQSNPYASVSTQTTIRSAIALLADRQIACVVVVEHGELRGVFTERDVLNKVADRYLAICDRPVSEVMTAKPMYVYDTDTAASALCVMAAYGYRHVPVVNCEQQVQGVVSPRRIFGFVQQHLLA